VRIALVSDTYTPQVNGVTTVLVRIVRALADRGHAAAVVAPRYPEGAGLARTPELRIGSIAFPPYPAIRLSAPRFGRVATFLGDFGPDLIHVATEGPLGLAGRRYAVRNGTPLVTSFHTHFPRYSRDYGLGFLEPIVWRWLLWFHGPARLTQTPGEAVVDELRRRGLARAVLWGRGIDTSFFHPRRRDGAGRARFGLPPECVAVLHVGRLAREKNIRVLIDAWKAARERLAHGVVFVVAGDGPMAPAVERAMPWARRLGFLDRETLATLYANADLCVLPSETETYGLTALEAMASGVPVIAADAGGLRESVRHEGNGLLASPGDARAFADAIARLAHDAGLRERLGAAARRTAEERDLEVENDLLLEQYRQAIGAPRSPA
jgi:glycosyltransferase involved in cell wall biosynthesis